MLTRLCSVPCVQRSLDKCSVPRSGQGLAKSSILVAGSLRRWGERLGGKCPWLLCLHGLRVPGFSPPVLQREVLTPPSWTPPLASSWSPASLTSGMAPGWGLAAAGTAQFTATVSCGFGLCPQHQPLPAGWSLTPRGSHRWGTFFPAVPLEPPPAAPSSLPLSSRCPKEDRSGVLGPWEDKGLIEALRPGCGGGEGYRAE